MTLDFETARRRMVDGQVRTVDVTNLQVQQAFLEAPRERFLVGRDAALAYVDTDLEVAPGRHLIACGQLARLVQAANVSPSDVVLDLGCASGYSSFVLGRLAASVIALEEDADLARAAETALSETGAGNVAVVRGTLTEGWPKEAPYDLIFVGGAIEVIPQAIADQVREGGRLVAVEGHGGAGVARLWLKQGDRLIGRPLFNCALPPIPGFARKPEFVF
jgi:protein-L-isoaspartate(D-aspartate) O-methyltransferase